MKVDVIIPTIKNYGALAGLLYEIRSSCQHEVAVIPTCQKVNAAQNRNRGLELSAIKNTASYVIMIDDDLCNFPKGWDVKLIEVLEQRQDCYVASARLVNREGHPGLMLGHPPPLTNGEWWVSPKQEVPTACIAFQRDRCPKFDEEFIGSGFEDTAWCAAIRARDPKAQFIVRGDVRVIHINEMKNQTGKYFEFNLGVYRSKWGDPR